MGTGEVLLINALIDLTTRLILEYTSKPDADPVAVEQMNTKLGATVDLVRSKRPVPPPVAEGPTN
jgi:hypothetical protein